MSKFDVYMKAYQELKIEFQSLEDERVQMLLEAWEISFTQIEGFLRTKQVTKSQMVSGLKQGLREIPEIISDLPSPSKELALAKYERVMSINFG